jgi:O-antigen/teichoic acid export membrane protein
MLRQGALLLSGNAAASLLSLVRNLLIARMISVEDFGIAATFALLMTLVEMSADLGLRQQIVQARDGGDPDFQAALQGFHLLRGAIAAAVVLALAGPVAAFLRLPELAWAYRIMAVVPLLKAFEHYDVYRMNRAMRFGPLLASETAPMALTLAVVWPLVAWLGDWRVMLVVIVLQAASRTALTHLVAERRYRVRFDPAAMRRSLAFGWPLLVNGLLLFGVFQGDRMLVARELGPSILALFSIGVTLTLTPTLVMAKSIRTLFLPRLSSETEPARFDRLSTTAMQAAMLNAGVMMVGTFLIGPAFVALTLGERYLPLLPYLMPLAAVQALRVLKTGSSTVALARGQTANAMISNLFRVAMLPLIWLALVRGHGIGTVILLAAIGEAMGYAVSLALVRRRLGQRLGPLMLPLAATILLMAAVALPGALLPTGGDVALLPDGRFAALALLLLLVQLLVASELRAWLARRASIFLRKGPR